MTTGRPTDNRGPLADTELSWFTMSDGRSGFRGVVGGLPRTIIGKSLEQLGETARLMRAGKL